MYAKANEAKLYDIHQNCLEAIALLGHTSREVSNRRKANLKPCLNPQTQEICSPARPTTKWLLGDDISKGAKEVKEVALLAKRTPMFSKPHRGNYPASSSSPTKRPPPRDYSNSYNNYKKKSGNKPFLAKGRKAQLNYNNKKK